MGFIVGKEAQPVGRIINTDDQALGAVIGGSGDLLTVIGGAGVDGGPAAVGDVGDTGGKAPSSFAYPLNKSQRLYDEI